jgi:hypothetical protein
VILLVNVSAWLNTRQYAVPWNAWYVWANTVSTFVFCAFAAWGAYRYLRLPERRASVAVLGRFIGAFLILDTLYPVSQHRYLLPIYPMLVLWAAGDRDRDSGRAVVSGSAAS